MNKIKPYRPNNPAPPGMFAGRIDEIKALENGLYQTKNGNQCHFLITGERGIGKSSLITYIKPTVKGDIIAPGFDKFNYVGSSPKVAVNSISPD